VKIHQLWATPLVQNEIPHELCSRVLDELPKPSDDNDRGSLDFNVWQLPGQAIQDLRARLEETVKLIVPGDCAWDTRLGRGWINFQTAGESNSLHHHGETSIVMICYLQAGPGAADLILVDPRPPSIWTSRIENGKSGRSFLRVRPYTGLVVCFPGYIMHAVEPHVEPIPRISLATNFWVQHS